MPKLLGPTVAPRLVPSVQPRPLPRSVVDVMALDESDFRRFVAELESDERFTRLVDLGVVSRISFRGRVPRHKYESHMDRVLVSFLEEYAITRHDGWQDDFFATDAVARRRRLAAKYGVPVGRLVPVLRYCSYLRELGEASGSRFVCHPDDHVAFTERLAALDGAACCDIEPLATVLSEFVQRHGLSVERFRELFFGEGVDEDRISGILGISRKEASLVLGLVDRIRIMSSFFIEMRRGGRTGPSSVKAPVAEFARSGDFGLRIVFTCNDVYDIKYRFNPEALSNLSREDSEFVERLRAVNQRKNLLCRIVVSLFRRQYAFLMSGSTLDMRPLRQSELARALGEDEAAVSRVIRDKTVRLPWSDLVDLKFFFRRVGDIVADIIGVQERGLIESGERSRPFTDREIRQILKDRYGVSLSRRSISYHRNRVCRDGNYYARKRRSLDGGCGTTARRDRSNGGGR